MLLHSMRLIAFIFIITAYSNAQPYKIDPNIDAIKQVKKLRGSLSLSPILSFRYYGNEYQASKSDSTFALAPSIAFEYPIHDHFSLLGKFATEFIPLQSGYVMFDINVGGKIPFSFSASHLFYLTIPVGLSTGLLPVENLTLRSKPLGINAGVLLGQEFFFQHQLGLYVELGYQYRYTRMTNKRGIDFFAHFHQPAVNIGVTYRF